MLNSIMSIRNSIKSVHSHRGHTNGSDVLLTPTQCAQCGTNEGTGHSQSSCTPDFLGGSDLRSQLR